MTSFKRRRQFSTAQASRSEVTLDGRSVNILAGSHVQLYSSPVHGLSLLLLVQLRHIIHHLHCAKVVYDLLRVRPWCWGLLGNSRRALSPLALRNSILASHE